MKISIPSQNDKANTIDEEAPRTIIKQSTFKLKLFSICKKKNKSEIKGEKESIKRTLYKCPYCDKGYSSVTRYEVHFRTHVSIILYDHFISYHRLKTGEKPYDCKYCSKKFNEKGNLKAHLRIHTNERPFPCTYPKCGMAFKTKGQLNDHTHRHSDLRPFQCPNCQSTFNRKTRLKVHLMIHSGKKPFKCSFPGCEKDFREKGNLTSHLKKHMKESRDIKDMDQSQDEFKEENSMKSTISNTNGCISGSNEINLNQSQMTPCNEDNSIAINPQSLLLFDMMAESEPNSNYVFHLNDFNFHGLTEQTEESIN